MQTPFQEPKIVEWPGLDEKPKHHPFWHYCRRCASFTKTVILFLVLNSLADFATFKPIHTFYEHMGWIK